MWETLFVHNVEENQITLLKISGGDLGLIKYNLNPIESDKSPFWDHSNAHFAVSEQKETIKLLCSCGFWNSIICKISKQGLHPPNFRGE